MELKNLKPWQKGAITVAAVVIPGTFIIASIYAATKLYTNYKKIKNIPPPPNSGPANG